MRTTLIAALSALAFGIAGSAPASADWRDAILGDSYFREPLSGGPARPSLERERNAKQSQGRRTNTRTVSRGSDDDTQRRPRRNTFDVDSHSQSGIASYYWQPQRVASGGQFNPNAMTAAHKTLPFGTRVRVTHANGRSVVVTINDRGPFVAGRVIDLSRAAAGAIGMQGAGLGRVKLAVLGRS